MADDRNLNLDDVAGRIVAAFPKLDSLEQRLSLELYRLLAEGKPVPPATLARQLKIPAETVNRILDSWPASSRTRAGG